MIHDSIEEYKMLHLLHRCQAASRTPSVLQFLNKDLEYLNLLHSYSAIKLPLFSMLVASYKVLKTHFQQSGEAAWGGIGGATMGNPLFLRTKDFLEECKK